MGTWITKKSKSVLGGRPLTDTSIISTGPIGLIVTVAVAFGRHTLAPAESTIGKVTKSAAASRGAVNTRLKAAGARNGSRLNIFFLHDASSAGLRFVFSVKRKSNGMTKRWR